MAETITTVLTELLRLYDWRLEIARREIDPTVEEGERIRKDLLRYGRDKKAAWEAARRVLALPSAKRRSDDKVTPMETLLRAWAHNEWSKPPEERTRNKYLIDLLNDAADEMDALAARAIDAALREIAALMAKEETIIAGEVLGGNAFKEQAAKNRLIGLRAARAVLTYPDPVPTTASATGARATSAVEGPTIPLEEAVRVAIQNSGRDAGRRLEEKLRALPCTSPTQDSENAARYLWLRMATGGNWVDLNDLRLSGGVERLDAAIDLARMADKK